MKTIKLKAVAIMVAIPLITFAGNKDRTGQAGGGQLLINPWATSSGMANANSASVGGLEATFLNVAGLATTRKTELLYTNTQYLVGSGISINAFGFSQRLGENAGVLGLAIMSMSFGDIEITTVDQPEGGIGTFSPQFINLGLSYARMFSNSIYGGITVRTISESIANAAARGVTFDMGIKYITGKQENLKFGIALKNVGPKMQYSGDGFATKTTFNGYEYTLEQRTEPYELPALLNIGASYDYYIGTAADSAASDVKPNHRITGAFTFTSNSFSKDQLRFGVEYAFKEKFMVRLGYLQEEGIASKENSTNALRGPTGGFTIQLPFGANQSRIALSYAYRMTNAHFSGNHSVGLRLDL